MLYTLFFIKKAQEGDKQMGTYLISFKQSEVKGPCKNSVVACSGPFVYLLVWSSFFHRLHLHLCRVELVLILYLETQNKKANGNAQHELRLP